MPMDRGDFHGDPRDYMPPYPFRSYDDFNVRPGKKRKRGQQEPSYNDDRAANRPHFFMNPHGPGYYPMPPYGDPYFYGGRPGYGREGPRPDRPERPDRPDEGKGMRMYPEGRRGGEPYNKNHPPGRDPRGYPGNFEPDRPMMRDQPMGPPQGMNRRDGPNAPPREGRPGAGG